MVEAASPIIAHTRDALNRGHITRGFRLVSAMPLRRSNHVFARAVKGSFFRGRRSATTFWVVPSTHPPERPICRSFPNPRETSANGPAVF